MVLCTWLVPLHAPHAGVAEHPGYKHALCSERSYRKCLGGFQMPQAQTNRLVQAPHEIAANT